MPEMLSPRQRRAIHYREVYLFSDHWKTLSARIKAERPFCEKCAQNPPARSAEVHHLTYETLGFEADHDVRALCRDCHQAETNKGPGAAKKDRKLQKRDGQLEARRKKPASERQITALRRFGYEGPIKDLSSYDATKLITAYIKEIDPAKRVNKLDMFDDDQPECFG